MTQEGQQVQDTKPEKRIGNYIIGKYHDKLG
jgi:hypothetical protein